MIHISDEAVAAAVTIIATKLSLIDDDTRVNDLTSEELRDIARAALTAALPHLGSGEAVPEGRKLAHDLTPEQADKLAFVLFYSSVTCAPQNIEAVVKEIDCCPGCEYVSTSGSTCHQFERGEYCPNQLAETLREIGAALYGPRDPTHYVPRERLGGSPLYLHPAPPSSGLMEEVVKALEPFARFARERALEGGDNSLFYGTKDGRGVKNGDFRAAARALEKIRRYK